jgi:hypothetical protein
VLSPRVLDQLDRALDVANSAVTVLRSPWSASGNLHSGATRTLEADPLQRRGCDCPVRNVREMGTALAAEVGCGGFCALHFAQKFASGLPDDYGNRGGKRRASALRSRHLDSQIALGPPRGHWKPLQAYILRFQRGVPLDPMFNTTPVFIRDQQWSMTLPARMAPAGYIQTLQTETAPSMWVVEIGDLD